MTGRFLDEGHEAVNHMAGSVKAELGRLDAGVVGIGVGTFLLTTTLSKLAIGTFSACSGVVEHSPGP